MNPLRTLLAAALAVSGGIAYTGDFSKASFSGQSDAGSQIVSQVAQEDNSEATESPAYSGWGHADAYGEVLAQLKGQQLQDSQKLSSIDAKLSTVMSRMQTMSQETKQKTMRRYERIFHRSNIRRNSASWKPKPPWRQEPGLRRPGGSNCGDPREQPRKGGSAPAHLEGAIDRV